VSDDYSGLWDYLGKHLSHAVDGFDAVVHEKDLPAARNLAHDSSADERFVEFGHECANGQPVGRRRVNDAYVAQSGKRHVKSARDRSGRHCDCVDLRLEFADALFVRDAEVMFFVDDEQPKV